MPSRLKDDLKGAGFRGEILTESPLAPVTTWRIGGPAELLATPMDVDDVAVAVRWASARGVAWRVLGNGSNLLVADNGVRGLVLRIRKALDTFEIDGSKIVPGAGVSFPALVSATTQRGLAGIEFGAGIPGTVGGAVVMNAGWHAFEIGNVVDAVTYLEPDGTIVEYGRDTCRFGYRASAFRGKLGIVLGATLTLSPDDPAAVKERLSRFAEIRKAGQPTELPSCGSVFLKPEGDFAGRLIEAAGLKGRQVGGIQVSAKHANFFVNVGGGTAHDALALVALAEDTVLTKFGVRLTREFESW